MSKKPKVTFYRHTAMGKIETTGIGYGALVVAPFVDDFGEGQKKYWGTFHAATGVLLPMAHALSKRKNQALAETACELVDWSRVKVPEKFPVSGSFVKSQGLTAEAELKLSILIKSYL